MHMFAADSPGLIRNRTNDNQKKKPQRTQQKDNFNEVRGWFVSKLQMKSN